MSLSMRLRAWLSGHRHPSFDATSDPTPPPPAEPPHALRQHFAVNEREILGFPVYSIAPMQFGATDGHSASAEALHELSPAQAADRAVLYILPGGFVNPIKERNWDFVGQLAEAGLRVEVPLYGLLPDHTVEQALPLVREVYSQLVTDHGADKVTIIADSAGGSLALGALTFPTPCPTPTSLILNAPWVDMDLANPDIPQYEAVDPLLNAEQLRRQGALWSQGLVAMGVTDAQTATSHPAVSPIHLDPEVIRTTLGSTDLHVFCGDKDLSLPDARAVASKIKKQGVQTTEHYQPGAIHMFHLTNSREGKHARKTMIDIATTGSAGA